VIYTQAVAALPAGACWRIEFGYTTSAGYANVGLYADAVQIANPTGAALGGMIQTLYCNNPGTQAAQTFLYLTPLFFNYGVGVTTPRDPAFTVDDVYHAPTGVDWSTGHTLYLKTTVSSGTASGWYFHVTQQ
jgi:hypothetical protein